MRLQRTDGITHCRRSGKGNAPPDPDLTEQLQYGRTNILFVGRIAPNKKQDDLVRAFQAFLEVAPSARLILVGPAENDPYAAHLRGLIESKWT